MNKILKSGKKNQLQKRNTQKKNFQRNTETFFFFYFEIKNTKNQRWMDVPIRRSSAADSSRLHWKTTLGDFRFLFFFFLLHFWRRRHFSFFFFRFRPSWQVLNEALNEKRSTCHLSLRRCHVKRAAILKCQKNEFLRSLTRRYWVFYTFFVGYLSVWRVSSWCRRALPGFTGFSVEMAVNVFLSFFYG